MIRLTELLLEYGWLSKQDRPREFPELTAAYKYHDIVARKLTGNYVPSAVQQKMFLTQLERGIKQTRSVLNKFRSKLRSPHEVEQTLEKAEAHLRECYNFYDGESSSRGFSYAADSALQFLHESLDMISTEIIDLNINAR